MKFSIIELLDGRVAIKVYKDRKPYGQTLYALNLDDAWEVIVMLKKPQGVAA